MRATSRTALILAMMVAGEAQADVSSDIRKCSAVEDDLKRLDCYDGLASSAQREASAKAAEELRSAMPPASKGKWVLRVDKSKIDDSTEVYAFVTASQSVHIRYQDRLPTLWLRCREQKTSVVLDFDGAFMADTGGYGEVTFRIDQKKAFTRSLDESTDNQALGFWAGGASIPFIRSISGAQKLLVRATPYSESAITIEFEIAGVDEVVKPIQKACGWQ